MILALETSCDESAVALFDADRPPVSLVSSQIELHRHYGGVVPELASRNHALHLRPLVEDALKEGGVAVSDIEAFAALVYQAEKRSGDRFNVRLCGRR